MNVTEQLDQFPTFCDWISAEDFQAMMVEWARKALISLADLVSILGNSLVMITISFHIRIRRTVASLLLLSLSTSNLLFSLLVVPAHIFKPQWAYSTNFPCKALSFLQTTSVVVTAHTLVAISVERYFAICRPMESLGRQTVTHVYPLMAAIWVTSFLFSIPMALAVQSSHLDCPNQTLYLCAESNWISSDVELAYTVFLLLLVVLIPSGSMALMYYHVAHTLAHTPHLAANAPNNNAQLPPVARAQYSRAVQAEQPDGKENKGGNQASRQKSECSSTPMQIKVTSELETILELTPTRKSPCVRFHKSTLPLEGAKDEPNSPVLKTCASENSASRKISRDSTSGSVVISEKRVFRSRSKGSRGHQESVVEMLMRTEVDMCGWRSRLVYMLIVIVVGHVVCWGPIHLMHFILRVMPPHFRGHPAVAAAMSVSYFLENISGCINPITFCFMSRGFRGTLSCLMTNVRNRLLR